MKRLELINVYKDTINCINDGYYNFDENTEVDIPELDYLYSNSKLYISTEFKKRKKLDKDTKIYVRNVDSFVMAKEMGPECAVLNMASSKHPGGGVHNGSRAQEEDLCRRSNLLYSLYKYSLNKYELDLFGFNVNNENYPIPTFGGIYSPHVCVFKNPITYSYLKTPFMTNIISVSGVVRPDINKKTGLMEEKYSSITKKKIRTILRIAADNGHKKLVLGALGCGAFKNPPKHVAILFKEVLKEDEFSRVFEEICFAILEDNNSIREDNPEGNLKPFLEIFH